MQPVPARPCTVWVPGAHVSAPLCERSGVVVCVLAHPPGPAGAPSLASAGATAVASASAASAGTMMGATPVIHEPPCQQPDARREPPAFECEERLRAPHRWEARSRG